MLSAILLSEPKPSNTSKESAKGMLTEPQKRLATKSNSVNIDNKSIGFLLIL
jgi:hypothetical protein